MSYVSAISKLLNTLRLINKQRRSRSVDNCMMASTCQPQLKLPRIYLLLENPKKSNNLGSILRCASAFGVSTIVAVGFSKCAVAGSHGAAKHVEIVNFSSGDAAIEFLRSTCACSSVVGLMGSLPDGYLGNGHQLSEHEELGRHAICDSVMEPVRPLSFPINSVEFPEGNICFALSKYQTGLSASLARLCTLFVHVPQSTRYTKTPLLDTPCCLSLLLNVYTKSVGYDERTFRYQKFELSTAFWNVEASTKKKNARAMARSENEQMTEAMSCEGFSGDLFSSEICSSDY